MHTKIPCFFFVALLLTVFLCSCNKATHPDGPTISTITITSLKPAHGPFDTIDTIIGQNLDQIPSLDSILLNGKKMVIISRSPEQVVVKIPAMAGTGNMDIWYEGKLIQGPVFSYDSILMVTTLAGSNDAGAADGQGLEARFNQPGGIAVDHSGNIYVADMNNSSIRKITSDGKVTTLAGPLTGERDYVDGTGATAKFSDPWGLTIDTSGLLYVGDQYNYRVRKVSPAGLVTTFAGSAWDGIPYHAGSDGDASVATFDVPTGVASDLHGNIYVADMYNNKIRKITPGGTVSTLAGGDYYHYGKQDGPAATALFFSPSAVAVDLSGNIYVSDAGNYLLRKITPDGMVSTLLGPMEPSITGDNQLFSAGALATDKAGNLFFSISEGIIKMTPDHTIIRYAAGGIGEVDGPAQIATFRSIGGIAVDNSGNLFITDNNKVRKIGWQ